MKTTSYSLKCRIANRGYIGGISLKANLTNDANVIKVLYNNSIEHKWRDSISFAINHFFEFFFGYSDKGLLVEIENLSTLIVDTKQIVVVLITLNCLSDCFSLPYLAELDEVGGKFLLKG
jgi:hypothetical protein